MKIHQVLFLMILLSLSACRTLIHADGSKSRSLFLAKDNYKKVAQEDLEEYLQDFNIKNLGVELKVSKPDDINFEQINIENIREIAQKNKATLVILWYPNCGSIMETIFETLDKAKNIQDPNFDFVLVSTSYNIEMMQNNLFAYQHYILSYLLPHSYGKTLLDKNINLGKQICPSCYETRKDDLGHFYVYLLDPEAKVVSAYHTIYKKELKRSVLSDIDSLDKKIKELLENKSK